MRLLVSLQAIGSRFDPHDHDHDYQMNPRLPIYPRLVNLILSYYILLLQTENAVACAGIGPVSSSVKIFVQ